MMQTRRTTIAPRPLTGRQARVVSCCVWGVVAVVFAALLAGCGEEAIEVYQIPKQPPDAAGGPSRPPDTAEGGSSAAPPAVPGGLGQLVFSLPEGWTPTSAGPMVLHAIDAGDEVAVSITRFPGDVGGMQANVARWARQLGIAPGDIPPGAVGVSPVGQGSIDRVRLAHAGKALMVDVVSHRGETWFFKMTGPVEPFESRIDSFNELLIHTRLPGGESTLGGQP